MNKILLFLLLVFATTQLSAQCGEDTHTNLLTDSWKSCTSSANPNPDRPSGHWLLYNFGHVYQLKDTYIWNFNEEGQKGNGLKNVAIDYSLDGLNWVELGPFEFPQASGSNDYTGFEGPDFGGVEAQYVLISALSNWDGSECFGLSEIKFYVDAITSTSELKIGFEIEIFPNPGKDVVQISSALEAFKVEIFNANGQRVQSINEASQIGFIDVSNLTNGLYYFQFQAKEGIAIRKKFVKLGE